MLEIIDIGLEHVIAYRVGEKVTRDEMNKVLDLFKEKIDRGEKLMVYQEIMDFKGLEIEALVEKLKFFSKAGLSHFSRVAVVTPKKWATRLVELEGRLFKGFQMKGFAMEDRKKAVQFLKL